jgi:penicillin-binding protein 1C
VKGAWARRSPGSALKPFTYLLAFEHGATPATVAADVPSTFLTSTGVYAPEDFTQRCCGPMRYRLALANSLNIPAVRVLESLGGPAPLRSRLQHWGLTTLDRAADEYGLGLTIGDAEVRLIELTNAYACLARLGRFQPYRLTLDPQTQSPAPPYAMPDPPSGPAWLIADILSDNEARVHSFGRESALRFEFPVACKTGTSTDFRDNWSMGYSPEFTVGVWVGNFDGSAMHKVSGVTGAAPILHDVFEELHRRFGTSWYPRPADIVERDVHPLTGKLLMAPRPNAVHEKFLVGHLPQEEAPSDYDEQGRVVLGPEYQEWLASAQNSLGTQVAEAARAPDLRLVAPVAGTTFVVDPDVPSSARIPLLARGHGALVWHSDSLVCREENGRCYAEATPGTHRLSVRDSETGKVAETWVVVKEL